MKNWDDPISAVEIDTDDFARKHLESFRHAYGKCRAYDEVMACIEPAFKMGQGSLGEFNIDLITRLAKYLEFSPTFLKLSELGIGTKKNQLLIDIANATKADTFVSGIGAKAYIQGNEDLYADSNVNLAFQNFIHPEYRQRKPQFVQNCSILDLVFNTGTAAGEILTSQQEPAYREWSGC